MTVAERWLLPDGIEEILPEQARKVEALRREMLDLFDSWGYQLVLPPHLEFMESLTAGVGRDLDLQTFKVTDQLTGRSMGLRADTTPAVARIDAHALNYEGPVRLCYAGSVFHTRPASLGASRSPIQLGAELYGHAGVASDLEVISLMLETLIKTSAPGISLDLGHVRIYRALVASAGLDEQQAQQLFEALQRKAVSDIEDCLRHWAVDESLASMVKALIQLSGGAEVLEQARILLQGAPLEVFDALDDLDTIAREVTVQYPDIELYFDLGELRGYNYHTGVVFAAYVPGVGQAIAKGGRYDGIGKAFGRARPATGFSTDLKALLRLKTRLNSEQGTGDARKTIFAAVDVESVVVQRFRRQGERVIRQLPGQSTDAASMGCDHQLTCHGGKWLVESL